MRMKKTAALATSLILGLSPVMAFAQDGTSQPHEQTPGTPGGGHTDGKSVLKICKVAGDGVDVGTPFTFTSGSGAAAATTTVPAGPKPGGYCKVVGAFPTGSHIHTAENVAGTPYSSSSITIVPATSGTANVQGNAADVVLAPGVTEITFVNDKHTGYIEICKTGVKTGTYHFQVKGTKIVVDVPAGACSPAVEVPAGVITLNEIAQAGDPTPVLVDCATLPDPSYMHGCTPGALGSVSVQVDAGGIADQTVVIVKNQDRGTDTGGSNGGVK